MKYLLALVIISILAGCNSKSSKLLEIQNEYLEEQVSNSLQKLAIVVEETGNTSLGVDFVNHGHELLKKRKSLINAISHESTDEIEVKTKQYIEFSKNAPDSIEVSPNHLIEALEFINNSNALVYRSIVNQYTIEVIEKYRERYLSYFYIYDISNPIIIPSDNNKIGEPYSGEIIIESLSSAISPRISVDFVDDEHGYFDIPVTSDGRGHLKIQRLAKEKTEIHLRVVQYNNGKERQIDSTILIEAKKNKTSAKQLSSNDAK